MYAVIKTGGKQYRVAEGDVLQIEKLEVEAGDTVNFDHVLMISDDENVKIGTPFLEGSKVSASVESQMRGKKIRIMKFKRRKHHQKCTGHRQYLTEVKITSISA